MFFDRYEMHIQAFVHFMNGNSIIFQSSSPQKNKEYVFTISQQKSKTHRANMVPRTYVLSNIADYFEFHIDKIIFPHDDSIIFLVCFEAFW